MYFNTCKFGIHGNQHFTLLLKLKLVSHILSNRHEIYTQTTLIILLKKDQMFELYGVKLWDCKPQQTHSTLPPHSSTSAIDIQKWKPPFLIIKKSLVKILCLLDKR